MDYRHFYAWKAGQGIATRKNQVAQLAEKFAPTAVPAATAAAPYLIGGVFDSDGVPKLITLYTSLFVNRINDLQPPAWGRRRQGPSVNLAVGIQNTFILPKL